MSAAILEEAVSRSAADLRCWRRAEWEETQAFGGWTLVHRVCGLFVVAGQPSPSRGEVREGGSGELSAACGRGAAQLQVAGAVSAFGRTAAYIYKSRDLLR